MLKPVNISDCGKYRYTLSREWAPFENMSKILFWVMLNPSTADANKDDPTIRRVINFSKRDGYTGMVVYNLFAYRATEPWELKNVIDPVGPENDRYLETLGSRDVKIVLAWGNNGDYKNRFASVINMLSNCELCCLGRTKKGQPQHPLYLPKRTPFISYDRY